MKNARDILLDGATLGAAVCAIIITVVAVLGRDHRPTNPRPEDRFVEDWEQYFKGGRRIGPVGAALTVIEFGDYECPACRSFQAILETLMDEYPGQLSLVYHHWPLSNHRYAYPAARAAECAGKQGRFAEFHSRLFKEDNWFGDSFERFAKEGGVSDLEAFLDCAGMEGPIERIEQSTRLAEELEATGTPTVLVNGIRLGVPPTFDELEEMLITALGEQDGTFDQDPRP